MRDPDLIELLQDAACPQPLSPSLRLAAEEIFGGPIERAEPVPLPPSLVWTARRALQRPSRRRGAAMLAAAACLLVGSGVVLHGMLRAPDLDIAGPQVIPPQVVEPAVPPDAAKRARIERAPPRIEPEPDVRVLGRRWTAKPPTHAPCECPAEPPEPPCASEVLGQLGEAIGLDEASDALCELEQTIDEHVDVPSTVPSQGPAIEEDTASLPGMTVQVSL